jgi:hypothetical protein
MLRKHSLLLTVHRLVLLIFRSEKLYKAKFKEWNWQKNLPVGTALFMKEKAKRRKREEGKDTVFSFGGRVWDDNRIESTATRAKKSKISEDMAGELRNTTLF